MMAASSLRRHATSIALLVAAAGLGAYMLWVDRDKPTTDQRGAREDNLLPILRREAISEVAIERGGESFRILRRDQGDSGDVMYYVAFGDPQQEVLADQVAVEQLLQSLELASRLRPADDADPAVTGLQAPQARLTIQMDRVTYRLAVGNESKVPSNARYVHLEGEGAFVVRGTFIQDAVRPLATYRSKTLLPYVSSELKAIRVTGDGQERHFVRGPWGGFRVGPGEGPRVSQVVFDRLLTSFAAISAERFLDNEKAAAIVRQASTRVELVLEPKRDGLPRAVIAFGGACPEEGAAQPGNLPSKLVVALRSEPSAVAACVPSSVFDDLRTPLEAYRDRSLFQLRQDEVEELTLRQGDRELQMARKSDGWHVRKPVDQELASRDAEGFLTSLLALEGEIVSEVDAKQAGLEPPRGVARILLPAGPEEQQPERVVHLGAPPDDRGASMIVKRDQDGVLLRLTSDQARLLVPTTTLIRSTQVIDVPEQSLQRVEILGEDGAKQVVQRSSSGFDLVAPVGFSPDAHLAVTLFQTVSSLKAERWVADADDGSFGLGKPSLVVTMQVQSDAGAPGKLVIGDNAVDGRYATVEPGTGVFIISRTVENTLRAWVIDRSSFMVDPNLVRSLRLVSAEHDVRIEGKAGAWSSAPGSKPVLPDPALATIRQALIDLGAEGVVHLGGPRAGEGFDKPALRIEVTPSAGAHRSPIVLRIGRGDVWRNTSVYYARREGIDATFAIAASKLRPLLDLLAPR